MFQTTTSSQHHQHELIAIQAHQITIHIPRARIIEVVNMSRQSGGDLEDEARLPEDIQRVGYDADTQTYSYRDQDGSYWEGAPGARYGVLHRSKLSHLAVLKPRSMLDVKTNAT